MLTESEEQKIIEKLTLAIVDQQSPRMILCTHLPASISATVPEGLPPAFLFRDVVARCKRSGYTFDPPAIFCIFELLETFGHAVPTELSDRLKTPPPTTPHPFDAEILNSKLPFLNRTTLRQRLRDMCQPNATKPILILSGGTKTGKTYVGDLVEHFCMSQPETLFCRIPVHPDKRAFISPEQVAKDLVTELGGTLNNVPEKYGKTPEKYANKQAWLNDLANWVTSIANNALDRECRAWFFLDGFAGDDLRSDTQDFLHAFAQKFTSGMAANRHRLILSDFSGDFSSTFPTKVEAHQNEPIKHEYFRTFVTKIIKGMSNIPEEEEPTLITETLNYVVGNETPPYDNLETLGKRLQDIVKNAGV